MAQVANTSSEQLQAVPSPASVASPAKRGGKLLLIILLIAVLVLLLAVVGIGALLVMKKSASTGTAHETPVESVVPPPPFSAAPVQVPFVSAIDINKAPVFVQLDPFTVNLQTTEDEGSHYLQADIVLRVNEQKTAEALKGWMPEMRNRINLILTSKFLRDIQNDKGQERLQSEILLGLNAMFGVQPPPSEVPQTHAPYGPIQGVLFNSFIVQ
ncbi:MAG: flagellar basal body-associated FliL family protein [Azoarcus sp.]|jgi:flagellar FliL protein|nr:flagellar basal body-associated FliL family protein [Azoarcus sp.]